MNFKHMPAHETKICVRCNNSFECKTGDIAHCQCNNIELNIQERAFIEDRYSVCFCVNCLLQLKNSMFCLMQDEWSDASKASDRYA